jgi:DNA-binding IclR family transcriptional regulator
VLLAFDGAVGPLYAQARRERVLAVKGDRAEGVAGVSSPVFGADGRLVGALTLTLPVQRFKPGLSAVVRAAAKRLTESLGGQFEAA